MLPGAGGGFWAAAVVVLERMPPPWIFQRSMVGLLIRWVFSMAWMELSSRGMPRCFDDFVEYDGSEDGRSESDGLGEVVVLTEKLAEGRRKESVSVSHILMYRISIQADRPLYFPNWSFDRRIMVLTVEESAGLSGRCWPAHSGVARTGSIPGGMRSLLSSKRTLGGVNRLSSFGFVMGSSSRLSLAMAVLSTKILT